MEKRRLSCDSYRNARSIPGLDTTAAAKIMLANRGVHSFDAVPDFRKEMKPEPDRVVAPVDTHEYAIVLTQLDSDGSILKEFKSDDRVIKIGKLASSHLRIDHETVSRMHAVMELTDDGWLVIDLGSTRGTTVNGERINKCMLKAGDVLTLGDVQLKVAQINGVAATPEQEWVAEPLAPVQVKTLDEQLLDAIRIGDFDSVKKALEKGASPNARCGENMTALMLACDKCHEDIAYLLIHEGADVNAVDDNGITALMDASGRGLLRIAEAMLERGADPNAADNESRIPLTWAIWNKHSDIVDLLKRHGARLPSWAHEEPAPVQEEPPIYQQEENAATDAQMQEDTGPRRPSGKELLVLGLIATTLMAGVFALGLKIRRDRQVEDFSIAVQHGDMIRAKKMLVQGADVNAMDRFGRAPLMIASIKGNFQLAKLLIEKGADVDEKDKDGCTPIMGAAFYGQRGLINLLISKGANVNARDARGHTALYYAKTEYERLSKAKLPSRNHAEAVQALQYVRALE